MQEKEYSIEKGLISKLLEVKDVKLLKDQQIKESFFTGENRRVYKFINEEFNKSGEVPTERVVLHYFPNFALEKHEVDSKEVVGTDESLLYWCNQLRQKTMHNRMADSIENVAKLLDEGSTEEAFKLLKKGIYDVQTETVITSSVDITKNADDRKKDYLERKKNEGMMGIPTGINHLDYILKGLIPETLTTVIATPGIGKTWLSVLISSYVMVHGYKVCFFVTEMSTKIMEDRFDAMLFSMMYGDFNYGLFRSGKLSKKTEEEYFNFLEDKERLEPLIIDTATDVSSVIAVIEKEKPDLVCIDGAYLMEDEQNADSDWLRVTHITRSLKKVAKERHLPILINSQADKSTSKKTGPELDSISFSQSVGQDSDNVLAMFRDEVMRNDNEMGIKVLKQREGILGKVIIQWDFNHMNFNSIYSESSEDKDKDDEEIDKETEGNILKEE